MEQLELGLKTQKATPKQGKCSSKPEISPVGWVGRCAGAEPAGSLKLCVVSPLQCFSRGGSPCDQDTTQ